MSYSNESVVFASRYPTLAAAITAAEVGATIMLAPKTYTENITIGKSLTIRGSAGSNITGNVTISASTTNVTLRDLTITSGTLTVGANCTYFVCENCVLSSTSVVLNGGFRYRISNCHWIGTLAASAVLLYFASGTFGQAVVENCSIMLSASGQIAVVANAAASIFTLNFKNNIVGANGNAISSMSALYMPCANQYCEFIGNIFLMTNLTAMTSTVEMFILGSSTQGCVHPTFSANKFVRLVTSPSSAGFHDLVLFSAIGIVINGNQFDHSRGMKIYASSATWNAKTVIAITGNILTAAPDASNALIDLSSLSTQKAVITGNSYGVDDLTTKPTFISCSAGNRILAVGNVLESGQTISSNALATNANNLN